MNAPYSPTAALVTTSVMEAVPASRFESPAYAAETWTSPSLSNTAPQVATPSRSGTPAHPGTPLNVTEPCAPDGSTEAVIVTGCATWAGVDEIATTGVPLATVICIETGGDGR